MSAWDRLRAAAAGPTAALEAALADPGLAQRRLLAALIARHRETDFGRAHGFAEIDGLEAFRAAVPIRPAEAFRPWVARMAEGEAGVLTADPPLAFEETGGTSAGGKLVALTGPALAAFSAAVLPWLGDLARRRPGVTEGSAYVTISPATRAARVTSGGVPIGLPDTAYLGAELAEAFAALLAVPPQVAGISDVTAWRRETLRHLVEREDLSFVSVWSPTFFLDLIEALPIEADGLAGVLSPEARRRLVRALSASGFDCSQLWPRLDTISCWADAASAPYAARLAARSPQAVIEPKGLLATESAITLPFGGESCVPALTSAVIEFIGADGRVCLCDEVEIGGAYDVVLTTPGGLWRYAIGDRVGCVGRTGGVPRLVFLGRAGLVGDLVGEKLDEAFVVGVLAGLGKPAALVARGEPPGWELWIDAADREVDAAAMAAAIDRALRADPQWAHARDIGQLPPLVGRMKPGFRAARAEARARAGGRLGVEKPMGLMPEP